MSSSAKEAFIRKFNISDSVEVLYNPLDEKEILRKSYLAIEK